MRGCSEVGDEGGLVGEEKEEGVEAGEAWTRVVGERGRAVGRETVAMSMSGWRE